MGKVEEALNKASRLSARNNEQATSVPNSRSQVKWLRPEPDINRMSEPLERDHEDLAARRIVSPDMADAHLSTAFWELRARLLAQTGPTNCMTLVTSVAPAHGSSFVAVNLASAICAGEDKTALLIDCNVRDPAFGTLAFPAQGPGLVQFLSTSDVRVQDIIHATGIRKLRLIPAGGHSRSTEYFSSQKMQRLLHDLKQRYRDRYLILDAPPVLHSADTVILAQYCDYVLLVVPYGKVVETQIQAAVQAVGSEKLLGVVFNDQSQSGVSPKYGKESFFKRFKTMLRPARDD